MLADISSVCRIAPETRYTSQCRGQRPLLGLTLAMQAALLGVMPPATSQVLVSYGLYSVSGASSHDKA